jgi:hypothetical protein
MKVIVSRTALSGHVDTIKSNYLTAVYGIDGFGTPYARNVYHHHGADVALYRFHRCVEEMRMRTR